MYYPIASRTCIDRPLGDYQLDSRAELGDIFWGMYHWLDNHPTETILVSVKVDNGENTASLQQQVFDLVTNDDVANYWALNTTVRSIPNFHNDVY